MAEILDNTDDLRSSLDALAAPDNPFALSEQGEHFPKSVDPEIFKILDQQFLDPEYVDTLRAGGYDTPIYRTWLIWRRNAAIRLHAQKLSNQEIGDRLGVSASTIAGDLKKIRDAYKGATTRDWALVVEERLMGLDADIADLRRIKDGIYSDIDLKLRVMTHIDKLEARRDQLLGLDKAAASRYETTSTLKVKLSFDGQMEQPALPDPVIDVEAVE